MAGKEKICLTRKELREFRSPGWDCFGKYGQIGCDLKCSQRELRVCRKVTLFLRRTR